MELDVFLKFLGNNFLFSFVILLISFILGWVLYNHVILRKISLKDALFEKDNLAAWVEFIGAFIFPTLFLSAKAIEGSTSDNLLVDLLVSVGYAVAYIILFVLLRMLSGVFVKVINISDEYGKVSLNNEIYIQKNVSASLFSVVLSMIFVNIIRFVDIDPAYTMVSLLKASDVIIFSLLSLVVYLLVMRRKSSLFHEIFVDNNIAAGVGFLGFVYAVMLLLDNAISLQTTFNYYELVALSLVSLVLFGVLSFLFRWIFHMIIRVDFWKEVYEHNSVGAAIGQAALYIGVVSVIVNFMK